jgi:hypothetical protein
MKSVLLLDYLQAILHDLVFFLLAMGMTVGASLATFGSA